MRVSPGQPIPFWHKIWDGNSSVYVVAHVTSLTGVEQPGSPYLLTYSGNRGIYTGVGPVVGASDLRIDYEVFNDAGLTQPSKKYLPNWEEVEADIANSQVLNTLLGKLSNLDPDTIQGLLDQSEICGSLDESMIDGEVNISSSTGTIENSIEEGLIDFTTIEGKLE